MHYVAEWGTAAHWAYKSDVPMRVSEQMMWLREIKDWDVESPSIFMERVRNELLGTRTFVFGPNGDIMNLARGTTLGDLVEGGLLTDRVMVNGVCQSLGYKVKNGDLISY
jgi:GTP pyrophosphokinase